MIRLYECFCVNVLGDTCVIGDLLSLIMLLQHYVIYDICINGEINNLNLNLNASKLREYPDVHVPVRNSQQSDSDKR